MPDNDLTPEFLDELRYGTSDPKGKAPDQVPVADRQLGKTPLDDMIQIEELRIEGQPNND